MFLVSEGTCVQNLTQIFQSQQYTRLHSYEIELDVFGGSLICKAAYMLACWTGKVILFRLTMQVIQEYLVYISTISTKMLNISKLV